MSFMAWSCSCMERKNSTRYQHGGILISSARLLGELDERLGSVLSFGEGDDTAAIIVMMRTGAVRWRSRLGEAPKLLFSCCKRVPHCRGSLFRQIVGYDNAACGSGRCHVACRHQHAFTIDRVFVGTGRYTPDAVI